jgi:hypothetical protein
VRDLDHISRSYLRVPLSRLIGRRPDRRQQGVTNMRMIRIIGIIAAMLATANVVTPASACPAGYVQCGGACCPGK